VHITVLGFQNIDFNQLLAQEGLHGAVMSGPRARSWRVTANHWRHRIWMTAFDINQPLK